MAFSKRKIRKRSKVKNEKQEKLKIRKMNQPPMQSNLWKYRQRLLQCETRIKW